MQESSTSLQKELALAREESVAVLARPVEPRRESPPHPAAESDGGSDRAHCIHRFPKTLAFGRGLITRPARLATEIRESSHRNGNNEVLGGLISTCLRDFGDES